MQRWYRSCQVPSLIERCDRAEKQLKPRARGPSDAPPQRVDAATVAGAVRHGATGSRGEQLQWSLRKILGQLTSAEGYVFAQGCVAQVGEASMLLSDWVGERLAEVSTQRPEELGESTVTDRNELQLGERSYRLLPLRGRRAGEDGAVVVGALVLPSETVFQVSASLLRALGGRLGEASEAQPA